MNHVEESWDRTYITDDGSFNTKQRNRARIFEAGADVDMAKKQEEQKRGRKEGHLELIHNSDHKKRVCVLMMNEASKRKLCTKDQITQSCCNRI